MNFVNGDEPTTASWGPNHSTLHAAAANGGTYFTARPGRRLGVAGAGQRRQVCPGLRHQHGFGIQHDAIAADSQYLYCTRRMVSAFWSSDRKITKTDWKATWTVTICRYEISTGKLVEWPDSVRGLPGGHDGGERAVRFETVQPRRHRRDERAALCRLRDKKCVFVLDAASGQPLEKIPLAGVRHLSAGKELFAATDAGVVRVRDQKLLIQHGDISGLTLAPNGDILISDAAAHQVRRFSSEGKALAVIGKAATVSRSV